MISFVLTLDKMAFENYEKAYAADLYFRSRKNSTALISYRHVKAMRPTRRNIHHMISKRNLMSISKAVRLTNRFPANIDVDRECRWNQRGREEKEGSKSHSSCLCTSETRSEEGPSRGRRPNRLQPSGVRRIGLQVLNLTTALEVPHG